MYSKRLKNMRLNNKLTQKDISNELKISEITYTHYESEYYIMPLKYLIQLCNYFKVSLDYIFELTDKYMITDSKDTNEIIAGLKLKEFRKNNKITQDKLAIILNTNRSVLANYERGRNYIATPFLYTICKKYKVSADYLLGKTTNPKIN